MRADFYPLQMLLFTVSGWVNRLSLSFSHPSRRQQSSSRWRMSSPRDESPSWGLARISRRCLPDLTSETS